MQNEDYLKMNMIKDRRSRLLYLINNNKEGYQIMEYEMTFMNLYTSRFLFALMVFLVPFGMFKKNILLSVGLAFLVIAGFEVYFRLFFIKNRPIIKLTEKEFAIMHSDTGHKALRSQKFNHALIFIFVVLILFSSLIDPNLTLKTYEKFLTQFLMAVTFVYSFKTWTDYFKLKSKKRKEK